MPRFLRAALDQRTVTLTEAIRKMTSLPAAQFGLRDRGRIAAGMIADLIIVDPVHVADRADFATPHRLAEGIEFVVVNGIPTWRSGVMTGARAGRVLRSSA